MITIALLDSVKQGDTKGSLSWTHSVRMSRFGQLLAAIFILCLFVNGLIFLLRVNGYNTVNMVAKQKLQHQPDFALQHSRTLQQSHEEPPQDKSGTSIPNNTTQQVPVNPHDFRYVINRPDTCKDSPELIIVVCTSVKNFKERQAVRETWGSYVQDPAHKTKVVFLLGHTDSEDLQRKLVNESNTHLDIIQEDFHDSYRNLSIKSVAMLKWVNQYCNTARYLLKADDDMYINVPNLLKSLRKQKHEKFILGYVFTGARPVQDRRSKWYTPLKDFNEKYYPRYTSGTSYSMSVKAVPELFHACQQIKSFWLEDIYVTGLCARKAGVQQIHDGGFSYTKRAVSGCAFRGVVTGHDYNVEEIREIHHQLYSDPPLKC